MPSLSVRAPTVLAGDYNNNGTVDAGDYDVWRKYVTTTHVMPNDPIGGTIGAAQYTQWRGNFGKPPGSGVSVSSVPEPTGAALILVGVLAIWPYRRSDRWLRARLKNTHQSRFKLSVLRPSSTHFGSKA